MSALRAFETTIKSKRINIIVGIKFFNDIVNPEGMI